MKKTALVLSFCLIFIAFLSCSNEEKTDKQGDSGYSEEGTDGTNEDSGEKTDSGADEPAEDSGSETSDSCRTIKDLTWSSMPDDTMDWESAVAYCEELTECGYSDWHLPTISELRMLMRNCPGTEMPEGTCGVRDDDDVVCLESSCQDDSCYSCSKDLTGGHSEFVEVGWFWSSSVTSDSPDSAWSAGFLAGHVRYYTKRFDYHVHCVR